jgi:hypothetical protein
VVATQEGLAAGLFAAQPAVFAHVAVVGGEVVGFALWFRNFSTGRPGRALTTRRSLAARIMPR